MSRFSRAQRRGRKQRRARAAGVEDLAPWTPLERAIWIREPDGRTRPASDDDPLGVVWLNDRYQVHVLEVVVPGAPGPWLHLSIRSRPSSARHDWRDYQRIKNEIAGPEREAIEVYPRESDLVDTADQYHLWVLPEGALAPVGFREGRLVSETPGIGSGSQRPFEPGAVPPDLVTDLDARLARLRDDLNDKREGDGE